MRIVVLIIIWPLIVRLWVLRLRVVGLFNRRNRKILKCWLRMSWKMARTMLAVFRWRYVSWIWTWLLVSLLLMLKIMILLILVTATWRLVKLLKVRMPLILLLICWLLSVVVRKMPSLTSRLLSWLKLLIDSYRERELLLVPVGGVYCAQRRVLVWVEN